MRWPIDDVLKLTEAVCGLTLEGRPVTVRAWRYDGGGSADATVPVFLLDTDVPGNDPCDRRLTDHLYGGDARYRLSQEAILGIGGVRILRELGYAGIAHFHLIEGHSALLALEIFAEELGSGGDRRDVAVERVKRRCVFTTHTPVPAGHDRFPIDLAREVLGRELVDALTTLGCCDAELNMTRAFDEWKGLLVVPVAMLTLEEEREWIVRRIAAAAVDRAIERSMPT